MKNKRRYIRVLIVALPVVFIAIWMKMYLLFLPLILGVWFYLYSGQWYRFRAALERIPWRRRRFTSWIAAFIAAQIIVVYVMLYFVDFGHFVLPGHGPILCYVNKAKYGAVLFANNPEKYYRTCRLGRISRDDLAVVQVPAKEQGEVSEVVLRIVAKPGETVEIADGAAYVDGVFADRSSRIVARYNMVRGTSPKMLRTIREKCDIDSLNDTMKDIEMPVVQREREWQPYTASSMLRNMPDERLYPYNAAFHWNAMHWGSMRLPRKGETLKLTYRNVMLYAPLIERNEGVKICHRDGKATVNGVEAEEYTFKLDYYFCLCDNRQICSDSRFYGPIPENRIIGNVEIVH